MILATLLLITNFFTPTADLAPSKTNEIPFLAQTSITRVNAEGATLIRFKVRNSDPAALTLITASTVPDIEKFGKMTYPMTPVPPDDWVEILYTPTQVMPPATQITLILQVTNSTGESRTLSFTFSH